MFDNIGGKIKGVAAAVTWIGIIFSCITGLVMLCEEKTALAGFLIMIFGSLGSWLSSLTLYGFGQLIENSDILVAQGKNKPTKRNDDKYPASNEEKTETPENQKKDGLINEEEYNAKTENLKNE